MHSNQTASCPPPHILNKWILQYLYVYFTALFFTSFGRLCTSQLYSPTLFWSFFWPMESLYLELWMGLFTTWNQTGPNLEKHRYTFFISCTFVCSSVLTRKYNRIVHQHWRNTGPWIVKLYLDYSVCDRCGLMLALRFFSPMPSDWAHWLRWAATTASTTIVTSEFKHIYIYIHCTIWVPGLKTS